MRTPRQPVDRYKEEKQKHKTKPSAARFCCHHCGDAFLGYYEYVDHECNLIKRKLNEDVWGVGASE